MNKHIKTAPWGVKLSVIFLLISYITLLFLLPVLGLGLAFLIGLFAAIDRITEYNMSGW